MVNSGGGGHRLWRRPSPSADTAADATLMTRVVAGDDDAFAHLVARHERALYNYLLRMVQDEALTADLIQETWLRVFQHANRYDTTRKFTVARIFTKSASFPLGRTQTG